MFSSFSEKHNNDLHLSSSVLAKFPPKYSNKVKSFLKDLNEEPTLPFTWTSNGDINGLNGGNIVPLIKFALFGPRLYYRTHKKTPIGFQTWKSFLEHSGLLNKYAHPDRVLYNKNPILQEKWYFLGMH